MSAPLTDQIATLRALQAEQVAKEGGNATLAGRELALSYYMQEWVANEIVMGTNPVEAVDSLLFAITANMVMVSKNLSTIINEPPHQVFERFEDAININGHNLLKQDQPIIGDPITPATKQ